MTYTVLVTGATGKTGRRLVPRLRERDVAVKATHRLPAQATVFPGAEPVRFYWSDESTYEPAVKGADAVYIAHPLFQFADPAAQIGALLKRASAAGVRRVVLLSALGADQAPDTDQLRRVEIRVEESGLPYTILRPSAFMQNLSESHWSRLAEGIRERDEIALPGGEGLVSWVSADDIAAVAAAALTGDGHEGKGYTITGPAALTLTEVAGHVSAAAGRPIRYVETGSEQVRAGLIAEGADPGFAEYAAGLYVHALGSGAFGVVTGDVEAVTGLPATPFARFAAGAAEAWRVTAV